MEGKHTPGPWRFYRDQFFINQAQVQPNDGRAVIATVYGDFRNLDPDDENTANLYLIAAAPKLLEACEKALLFVAGHDFGMLSDWDQVEECLRAAIAKAKGEGNG